MLAPREPGHTANVGTELASLGPALMVAPGLDDLGLIFHGSVQRVLNLPMRAIYLRDQLTGEADWLSPVNVSESFLRLYEREGRHLDTMLNLVVERKKPAYNLQVMRLDEWLQSPVFRRVSSLHNMQHVIMAPIIVGGEVLGTLNFASDDPDLEVTEHDLTTAGILAQMVGAAAEAIRARQRLERSNQCLRAALELSSTAILIIDPLAPAPVLNRAAKRLLDSLSADESLLYRIAARQNGSPADVGTREFSVRTAARQPAVLRSHVRRMDEASGAIVASLSLADTPAAIEAPSWSVLSRREGEVASLIAQGLTDREIAGRLVLSTYTVRQHAKSIYQKLGVGSRVELTRLALGAATRPKLE